MALQFLTHARRLVGENAGRRLPLLASAVAAQHHRAAFLAQLLQGYNDMTSYARREAIGHWAIALVAEHGATEAERLVLAHIDRVEAAVTHDRRRAEHDRNAATAARSQTSAPMAPLSPSG